MASVKQINYVKSLLSKNGVASIDILAYRLDESIPNSLISPFIDDLRNGHTLSSEEWNQRLEQIESEEPTSSSGESKTYTLEAEIKQINSIFIKSFVRAMFTRVPEYFYSVAASSTGKYHPNYALGKGGLVRHTKAAAKFALTFFSNPILCKFNQDEKDIVLAAILLHDTCKHGLVKSEYTVHEHPILVKQLFDPSMIPTASEDQVKLVEKIFDCIACHMGPWTSSNYSSTILPTPSDKLEKFVHMCDYLAAQKFCEVKFE
jgi:hypothetical protein